MSTNANKDQTQKTLARLRVARKELARLSKIEAKWRAELNGPDREEALHWLHDLDSQLCQVEQEIQWLEEELAELRSIALGARY